MSRHHYRNDFNLSIGGKWTRTIMILIIANVSVFLIQLLFSTLSNYWSTNHVELLAISPLGETPLQPWYYPASNIFTKLFWLYPPDTIGKVWIWQMVTYTFLHSITDPWHLIFNMLVLWMFGSEVERALGTRKFLSLYFTAGIFAGICCCIFTPNNPILGASGAIFAIEVAFAMYYPNSIVIFYFFPIKAKYLIMLFASFTIINCLIPKGGHVAHFAHLGGLLYGFLFVRYSSSVNELITTWGRRRQFKEITEREDLQERVDSILVKVHREGMSNLTKKERSFLNNASKIYKQKR
ncbi:MAG: rhomboid family intramembrane serine protease [Candidatus Anammoxibacter sp.]